MIRKTSLYRTFFAWLENTAFSQLRQALLCLAIASALQARQDCVDLVNKAGENNWTMEEKTKKCPLSQRFIQWMSLRQHPERHSFQDYRSFILSNPDWPMIWQLRDKAEQRITDKDNQAQVAYFFIRFPPRSTDGHLKYAEALEDSKFKTRLKNQVKHIWQNLPLKKDIHLAFYKKHKKFLSQKDTVKRVEMLLEKKMLEPAKALEAYLPANKKQELKHRIAILQGGELPKKTSTYLYDAVRTLRASDPVKAAKLFINHLGRIEKHAIQRTRLYIGRELLEYKQPRLAYRVLKTHDLTSGAQFAATEIFMGWISIDFLNKPKQAMEHFKRVHTVSKTNRTKAETAYWVGRCYKALKNKQEANKWFEKGAKVPTAFYGQECLSELGRPLKIEYKKEAIKALSHKYHDFVPLIHVLKRSKHDEELLPFLYLLHQKEKSATRREEIFHWGATLSDSFAVEVGKYRQKFSTTLHRSYYPTFSLKKKTQVDTALLFGLIRQESSFNPKNKSGAGALGLMQVMPSTAKMIAKELNIPYHVDKLTDPEFNLQIGAHYLKQRLDSYQGELIPTIASYNAGPRPVNRWLERNGPVPRDPEGRIRWIELISYKETRNYVKHVLENYRVYKALEKE